MISGLYQSAGGMLANQYRQNVIANNLANADTVGFKRDFALLAQQSADASSADLPGPQYATNGVIPAQTRTDFSQGALLDTGQPLDIALDGPGFFSVLVKGAKLLTRDGRMRLDADGAVVSAVDGAELLSAGGAPLRVNPRGGRVSVDDDGDLRQDGAVLGQIGVSDVADYRQLLKAGAARFAADSAAALPCAAQVVSGHVESSAAQPVQELVNMIEASRAYQLNAQMVSLQDETAGRLISSVAA